MTNQTFEMKSKLHHDLIEMFILYEYGRQTPFASAAEYQRAVPMAKETYFNDPILHARVNHLVAHVLRIIEEAK